MKAQKYTRETIKEIGTIDRRFPAFSVGDTIAVSLRIQEGDKERIQVFEGDVIAIRNKGNAKTFTVRKISANAVSVERIFPYYSPLIESIQFVRKGKVRRAKLFYMRKRVGKAARVEELVLTKQEKEQEES
jgi:large subunit ribosomal protein L19